MATEKSKEILQYREHGLGYKRIAALTGYSLNTVKSVCRRNPNGEEKLCLQCGAKLVRTPHYREKKFCSDICRMAWWNSHPEAVNRKGYEKLIAIHQINLLNRAVRGYSEINRWRSKRLAGHRQMNQ